MYSEADREVVRLGRCSLVGLINSLIGYGVIFGAIARGFSPYASNFLGYALGFLCSFVLHRRWVFAAGGNVLRQFWRFLLAFLAAYAVNFATLHLLLRFDASPLWAQFPAALAYFLCMYAISRWWVFRGWARE